MVMGSTESLRWSYAYSKALNEFLGLSYARHYGLPLVVVRLFNTIGPFQSAQYGMVVPRFVRAALTGRPLEVYGDGQQSRCFCDVRDVVGALPRLLAEPACVGRVFNLGSDKPIQIGELAALVRDTLGSTSPIVFVPYETVFGAGFDDLRDRRPDLTRIRQAIGFEPSIPLPQTIRDIAQAMQRQASEASSVQEVRA